MPSTEQIDRSYQKAAAYVHSHGGFSADMLAAAPFKSLISEISSVLSLGVSLGAGAEVSQTLTSSLASDTFMFSGFKAFHQMKEVSLLLRDPKGHIRPFSQIKEQVDAIGKSYNHHYLQTEYHYALSSAHSAARWEQIQADGDQYDLQYRTIGDDKVRPDHAQLDGITLPPSDPFWDSFMPPNDWGCRCSAIQVLKGKYPVSNSNEAISSGNAATARPKQQQFRFNPGKEGSVFPPHHSYNISKCIDCTKNTKLELKADIGESELCKACEVIREQYKADRKLLSDRNKEFQLLKQDPLYTQVEFDPKTGGLMATHVNHSFDPNKGWYERSVQTVGYKSGHAVILGDELGRAYKVKSTEGMWNAKPFEIAGAETGTASNIRNALKHCAAKRETEIAVLFFPNDNFDMDELQNGLRKFNGLKGAKGSQYKEFEAIICIESDQIRLIKKGTATQE